MKKVTDNMGFASGVLKTILNICLVIAFLTFGSSILIFFFNLFSGQAIIETIAQFIFLTFTACFLLLIRDLKNIIKTVLNRNPFTLKNVKRFNRIGFATLYIGLVIFIYDLWTMGFKTFTFVDIGPDISGNIDLVVPFIMGLFSLVLAQIFKQAHQIYQENKLTI